MIRAAANAAIAAALVAGLLASCSSDDPNDGAVTNGLKELPCGELDASIEETIDATCYEFGVPLNRADDSSDGGTVITLPVVRLHSQAEVPATEPVLYLHGGPGVGAVDRASSFLSSPVLLSHDIVILDQRGSGLSTPSLDCPERYEAFTQALGSTEWDEQLGIMDAGITECRDRLMGSVGSLDGFNTTQSAQDLVDLADALDVGEWQVWGESYGTTLALELARTHPDRVSAMVLDSISPPGESTVDPLAVGAEPARRIFNACGTEPACNAAFPNTADRWMEVTAALDAEPFEFEATDEQGAQRRIVIDGTTAQGGLFLALYDSGFIRSIPLIISQLAGGDTSVLPFVGQTALPFVQQQSDGGYLSISCADNQDRLDPVETESLKTDPEIAALPLMVSWHLFCDTIDVASATLAPIEPGVIDVPVLVIAGQFDPITPAAASQTLAEKLPDAQFVLVPFAGHGPGRSVGCVDDVIADFFLTPGEVDSRCVSSESTSGFVTEP